MPFRWERLQPRLGHELDQHELARLKKTLDLARGYGCRVLFDAHNYGRYALKVGGVARSCRIDEEVGGRVPVAIGADHSDLTVETLLAPEQRAALRHDLAS